MALSASPRAALLRLPLPLPLRPAPISLPKQGFARPGASLAPRAKDSDDARTLFSEHPKREREGFSYGVGVGEEEQGETSSWNVLNQIGVELDSDKSYSILIYGTSALVTVWISAIMVSALDSIPLVPKMMEVVGLGFTIWFTSRYLIFKDNRDELITRIRSIKKQILGSDGD